MESVFGERGNNGWWHMRIARNSYIVNNPYYCGCVIVSVYHADRMWSVIGKEYFHYLLNGGTYRQ